MTTCLKSSSVYPWIQERNVCFRGYFIVDEIYYSGRSAIDYLVNAFSEDSQKNILEKLNGVFSIIFEQENRILLAVDRLRSLPLFYAVVENEIFIGDDIEALTSKLPKKVIDLFSEKAFRSSSLFVPGDKTLLEGLFQVEAGICVIFHKESKVSEKITYFFMEHDDFITDRLELEHLFWQSYKAVAKHLVLALHGRTAVVPLSGGADSRMVLRMLKMENYQKVLCFTYGKEGNAESEISRAVAKEYGFPWVLVPYTGEMWKHLRKHGELRQYKEFAFALTSTPHYQDFPAVKYLVEHKVLPENSVFVPGHTGDLITGGQITSEYMREKMSREQFLQTVWEKFFPRALSQEVKTEVEGRFPRCMPEAMEKMASQIEWFNVQERQAKFIVNSVRVYEFFGHEWLIPLWDNRLFEFWKHVPIELRYQRKLYFSSVKEQLPSTNDESTVKNVANIFRKIPGARAVLRKGKRILNWWISPLQLERSFSFWEYMKACLCGNQYFTINVLVNQKMLSEWKDRLAHEKE